MRTILHILTRPQDELTGKMIAGQEALPETTLEVVDLTQAKADYDALVDRIFAADSIQVS